MEEDVIVQNILDPDSRGFLPSIECVRAMADYILASGGAPRVGKQWPYRSISDEMSYARVCLNVLDLIYSTGFSRPLIVCSHLACVRCNVRYVHDFCRSHKGILIPDNSIPRQQYS